MFVSDLRPDWGETENREDQCPGLNHSPLFAVPMLWTGHYLCTCALGSVLYNYIWAHSKCEREKPRKKSQFLCWRGRTVPCRLTLISNKTVLTCLDSPRLVQLTLFQAKDQFMHSPLSKKKYLKIVKLNGRSGKAVWSFSPTIVRI